MNRPRVQALGTAAALFAAFLIGAFAAFPWERLTETILEEASRKAAPAGVRLDHGFAETISRFPPAVVVHDVSVANPLGSVRAPSLEVRLKTLGSIAATKPDLVLKSPTARLNVPGIRPLALSGIDSELRIGDAEAHLASLSIGGDLAVSGTLVWSFDNRRLSFADLSIRAPESLEPGLNLLRFSTGLRAEGNGRWRLRLP